MTSSKRHYREKVARRKEEKPVEAETPKYRDRAKERREDQNPDYEPTELGSFHAVAPPGTVDIRSADTQKISIEKSKYLGGDVEHTHLVKGLDYALLNRVRSEIGKKIDSPDDANGDPKASQEDEQLSFRTMTAKSVYQWIVKPQTIMKTNEMFLPHRMAFIFNMEGGCFHDIPTTLHRSKADCPVAEEAITVGIDGSVLDRITKIMSYLRLGASGKVLKKKKKEKDTKGKILGGANQHNEQEKASRPTVRTVVYKHGKEIMPPPAPPQASEAKKAQHEPVVPRDEESDVFVGAGTDYDVPPPQDIIGSPVSEDMDESPRNKSRSTYFNDGSYASGLPQNGYDAILAQAMVNVYQGDWQNLQFPDGFSEQYLQAVQVYDETGAAALPPDPRFMTQEEKDRGLGSVFMRDDERLLQLRERDSREKDPNFVSESYSECYPGYQEFNRETVDSDNEDDLSKMDMGGRSKGNRHRWDFETEEEWAKYNELKEAMPKAAFQFGVKMQDGRKTRKQNRDQKLNNEMHKINKILGRKKGEETNGDTVAHFDDDVQLGKKQRL